MTAPNQPEPVWMEILGLGAYTVGGSDGTTTQYGQTVTQDQVNALVAGPATSLTSVAGVVTETSDMATLLSSYLSNMPLQGLQIFEGFVPGSTTADFTDVPTAVATIMNALGLDNLSATTSDMTRLLQDIEILFDVFHITYQAGSPTDPSGTLGSNGKPTWYSAWNDLLAYISKVTGVTLTSPAPTIGTSIADAGTKFAQALQYDVILADVFHLVYQAGSSSDTPTTLGSNGKPTWYSAWNGLKALYGTAAGVSTPTDAAPTTGAAITAAQASATTAGTNAATAQTTANTANTAAGTAQTTANTGNTNTGTFLGYTRILADVFHLTYNAGSPSDTPTTLGVGGVGAGKPTWYSAWNGLLVLEGAVKATTAPSDTAPTTGTVIAANTAAATTAGTNASIAISNASAANTAAGTAQTAATAANTLAQGTVDGLYQAFNGGSSTGNAVATVKAGAVAIPATNIVGQTGATVIFGAEGGGNYANYSSATSGTLSWSHTIATGDLGVLVISGSTFAVGQTPTSTSATYGGVAMTSLGRKISSASSGTVVGCIEVWWLKSPPSGSQSIVVSMSGGVNIGLMTGNSSSYLASKVGVVGLNSGGGSSTLSQSAASATGNMVVAGFMAVNAVTNTPIASQNQTRRYLSTNGILLIEDANGASSVAFTATETGSSFTNTQWSGVTVELTN